MSTLEYQPTPDQATAPDAGQTRPLYIRRVPEPVWNRVHENAIRSRMRLSHYLVRMMAQSEPFPPQPMPQLASQARPKRDG